MVQKYEYKTSVIRLQQSHDYFEWTTGRTEVPLFHIDGKHNLTDLLTKKQKLICNPKLCLADWFTMDEIRHQRYAIIGI